MTSQPGLQKNTIHILPKIFQSKDNKTLKFSRVIEYNNRNFFLQKSCRKQGMETSSRPLSKKLYTKQKQLELRFNQF